MELRLGGIMKRLEETIKVFSISKPTIYVWIKKGCPVHYVGIIPFFDIKEIENWIKKGNN